MIRRRKTDGERIAEKVFPQTSQYFWSVELAESVDRLIRRRMAEAWEDGWFSRDCQEADWDRNPYRGRRKK